MASEESLEAVPSWVSWDSYELLMYVLGSFTGAGLFGMMRAASLSSYEWWVPILFQVFGIGMWGASVLGLYQAGKAREDEDD